MKTLLDSRNRLLLVGFLVLIVVFKLDAQEKQSIPNVEKTYIHTDRSTYALGEDLWYKAYNVYAYNNLLFNNSNVLYVELISPDSKIISRNKTRLEEGIGHGDFKLTDSLGVKSGTYQIRAYTNWNRNFDTDFVFKKEIKIINAFENENDKKEVLKKPKSKKANKKLEENEIKKTFDLQFFPEGGSLIEDVVSVVAFKATDSYGEPIVTKGKVLDSKGNLISLFLSTHDGMGKFKMKPIKNETYYAEVLTLDGLKIELPLPSVNKTGYLLSIKKIKEKEIVTIKTNKETLIKNSDAPITIIGKTRGITYFEGTQPLGGKTSLAFELPKKDFPDGISQITLYDSDLKPQSERLLFIENNHQIEVKINTDKTIYKPKEKVTINISSKSEAGEALPASYSLSSIDMNGSINEKDFGTNICSYFLIESDIRGKVHKPSYYFDESNPKRLQNLDLLLLTQGWRDFLWKKMPVVKDSIRFKAEKGITVSGVVKQLFSKKPKPNSNVTLALFNKGKANLLPPAVTDSLGQFSFKDMVFMGNATMMLNTHNNKGKNRGMFVLDSIALQAIKPSFKSDSINYTPEITAIKENVYKKYIMYGVAPENVLEEVEIIAKKKTGPPSLYGTADNTYVIDEKTQHFNDIFQLIQFTIPGVTTLGGNVGFNRFGGRPAYIMIDGVEWEQSSLRGISTDDVAKIEAFKGPSAAIFGSRGGNGVIIIYTKEGKINEVPNPVFHSITKQLEGFYDARYFYIPNKEETAFEMNKSAAIRNTLYWNPYMHPDETGEVQVSYPNSEVETKVKITLEGITATGIPVVKNVFYTVEN